MKEALNAYVKRVRDLAEHVRGNEQATKQSLIGPLFTLLGYDLTDPRECVPEFKADFGKDRSTKPVDYAFLQNGRPVFFVEAKEAGRKLTGYDEQLADYFAKAPEAKLGVLTNGLQWRFFTDVDNVNVMDREPFATWDVIADEHPPYDFLTLLQKAQFNAELIRTFAQRRRQKNLLVAELTRLLEPSDEFIKLAVANVETRKLTQNVVEGWRPTLAAALGEWAKQQTLNSVLSPAAAAEREDSTASKIETTKDELDGFALVQRMLGEARPVTYEDTQAYFKVLVGERKNATVCRFHFGKRRLALNVPLPLDAVQGKAVGLEVSASSPGWTWIALSQLNDIEKLADVLRQAWDAEHGEALTE